MRKWCTRSIVLNAISCQFGANDLWARRGACQPENRWAPHWLRPPVRSPVRGRHQSFAVGFSASLARGLDMHVWYDAICLPFTVASWANSRVMAPNAACYRPEEVTPPKPRRNVASKPVRFSCSWSRFLFSCFTSSLLIAYPSLIAMVQTLSSRVMMRYIPGCLPEWEMAYISAYPPWIDIRNDHNLRPRLQRTIVTYACKVCIWNVCPCSHAVAFVFLL